MQAPMVTPLAHWRAQDSVRLWQSPISTVQQSLKLLFFWNSSSAFVDGRSSLLKQKEPAGFPAPLFIVCMQLTHAPPRSLLQPSAPHQPHVSCGSATAHIFIRLHSGYPPPISSASLFFQSCGSRPAE